MYLYFIHNILIHTVSVVAYYQKTFQFLEAKEQ